MDFPTLDRFVEEIRDNHYDIVGISSIPPNFLKVRKMCELVRQHLPQATIVVGGHVANIPDLEQRIDADHIVRGEGVRWFRPFLGEDPDRPLRHPQIIAGLRHAHRGRSAPENRGDHGRDGHPVRWLPDGLQLLLHVGDVWRQRAVRQLLSRRATSCSTSCANWKRTMKVQSFFVMDENFLLDRAQALRLLELMERHDKAWSLVRLQFGQRPAHVQPSNSCGLG